MLAKFLFTSVPGAIILGALIVSTTILVAIRSLKSNNSVAQNKGTNIAQAAQPTQAPSQVLAATTNSPFEAPKSKKFSITGDPLLGEKNNKLTLVGFSDYGCPQCKKFFTEVLPEIRKTYVDSGKIKLVYKDLPIPSTASLVGAALCAKDQGGDSAYFKFHDQLVANMKSDGTNVTADDLPALAKKTNLNVTTFQKCLDSSKFQSEFEKNFAVAQDIGINKIPLWFLGKTNTSGEVEGTILEFAQTFGDLKTAIDQQLSQ
ncbi:hypothetical protein A2778_05650 [Candidatus Daviesbacteria bacterium RIFCSPHIGHO2_01_FULL_40_24]|uniref:DSBA oxidoreductase n=1 Tax=Candidatus Daviesbacteria bacterium GW2011_GWC2_40_12 TaxID=1618431 RepID=A0A0G0QZB3_9BACT|nr:MAG: DSBA oxidoreductase [Candidatus Daviesbacteria bacterium GW2011_GWA2_39_33]KKR42781.1 MAG: DSBA oxidoreductase [Candidatus Daviesbacteria bacterium GW2011_GWC2_40_12]OGE21638.1 MAG: hypothetical protein A2778_05650 [Candidatus Daviesbacteria bacterium RIFCSPHIGHO2_01_FULL_40_24]OGE30035.1 MAG: hypothetical protein A3C29_01355 [Candidatus Daviesbacteria bacterium RIFCSPHIGHO2_02_FULL_40_16]OGE43530.1 MAG: hypothetical protein A3A53_02760 [Candidatus Daviesbacteria bacterium RIFCSPLOWO2_0